MIVSLGTNDPQGDPDAFREAVGAVLEAIGPDPCVAWSTIWRSGPNDAFDDVLRAAGAAAPRLRLVEWAEMVAENPDWLASDGVHASAEGYRERAAAVGDAVRDCAPATRAGEP